MKELREFITGRFNELSRGIVATPDSRENLEAFAKSNQGSMDILLMQMAINYGYKMAMEDVQEIVDTDLTSKEEVLKDLELVNPVHLRMTSNGHGEFPDGYKLTKQGVEHIVNALSK
jgi:hypothetical protein